MKAFLFCVEHKSWKPFLGIFFDLFYMVHTSQDGTRDHWYITFHPDDPWFNPFTKDGGNLLRRFLLVKTLTPQAYLAIFYSMTETSCFYKIRFLKYLSWHHLHHIVNSYHVKLGLLSPRRGNDVGGFTFLVSRTWLLSRRKKYRSASHARNTT